MRRVAAFSTRRSRLVMGVAGVVAVLSIAGILKLRVDTNHINFFSDGHPLHESADLIDRDLSGVYSFQVFFEGPPDSMRDPAILARMDRLQQEILRAAERAQGGVAGRLRQARQSRAERRQERRGDRARVAPT